jgi:hypothetical protein
LELAERVKGELTVLPLYGLLTVVDALAGRAELTRRAEVKESSLKSFIRVPSEIGMVVPTCH